MRVIENTQDIKIHAGWMIDGTGASAVEDRALSISGAGIASINKSGAEQPLSGSCINYSGCTVIPGLTDCHVHLAVTGSEMESEREGQLDLSFDAIKERIEDHLKDLFKHGILAVRDGGDREGHALRFKSENGSMKYPVHIGTAGRALHGEGRYGSFLGRSPERGMEPADAVKNDIASGIDHVKIINSGIISLKEYGKETSPHFTLEDLKKIVELSHGSGMSVMVHANGRIPVGMAIDAGCDSIEHGFFMGDDNLKKLADKEIIWVPTLFAMEALGRIAGPGSRERETAVRTLDHQINQLRKACEYGVKVAIGTDSGSPGVRHGYSVINEMKLLMSAGLSIEKTIEAGSVSASRLFKKGYTPESLKQGAPATFLVVEGSPEKLPASLSQIRADRKSVV